MVRSSDITDAGQMNDEQTREYSVEHEFCNYSGECWTYCCVAWVVRLKSQQKQKRKAKTRRRGSLVHRVSRECVKWRPVLLLAAPPPPWLPLPRHHSVSVLVGSWEAAVPLKTSRLWGSTAFGCKLGFQWLKEMQNRFEPLQMWKISA